MVASRPIIRCISRVEIIISTTSEDTVVISSTSKTSPTNKITNNKIITNRQINNNGSVIMDNTRTTIRSYKIIKVDSKYPVTTTIIKRLETKVKKDKAHTRTYKIPDKAINQIDRWEGISITTTSNNDRVMGDLIKAKCKVTKVL